MARVGNWTNFTRSVADTLSRMPSECAALTLTLADIQKQSGSQISIRSLADPYFWRSCREGRDPVSTGAGLAIREHHDPSGAVFAVTYRLARSPTFV